MYFIICTRMAPGISGFRLHILCKMSMRSEPDRGKNVCTINHDCKGIDMYMLATVAQRINPCSPKIEGRDKATVTLTILVNHTHVKCNTQCVFWQTYKPTSQPCASCVVVNETDLCSDMYVLY